MSKYTQMGEQILAAVGGKDIVSQFNHCVTRPAFYPQGSQPSDEAKIKKIPGVLGTQWAGEQLQVIVGQDGRRSVRRDVRPWRFKREAGIDENLDGDLGKQKFSLRQIPGSMLRTLQGCVFPIIPIIIPAGLMTLFASMLGPNLFNILPADDDLITLFTFVGNAGMYFIPIFMAWSAAKYFNTSIPVALF